MRQIQNFWISERRIHWRLWEQGKHHLTLLYNFEVCMLSAVNVVPVFIINLLISYHLYLGTSAIMDIIAIRWYCDHALLVLLFDDINLSWKRKSDTLEVLLFCFYFLVKWSNFNFKSASNQPKRTYLWRTFDCIFKLWRSPKRIFLGCTFNWSNRCSWSFIQ